eukprot:COSAG01_NODE_2358_length_7838_cov_7.568807_1_plen_50_part_00
MWSSLALGLLQVQECVERRAVRSKVDVHCNCSHSFTFITLSDTLVLMCH